MCVQTLLNTLDVQSYYHNKHYNIYKYALRILTPNGEGMQRGMNGPGFANQPPGNIGDSTQTNIFWLNAQTHSKAHLRTRTFTMVPRTNTHNPTHTNTHTHTHDPTRTQEHIRIDHIDLNILSISLADINVWLQSTHTRNTHARTHTHTRSFN